MTARRPAPARGPSLLPRLGRDGGRNAYRLSTLCPGPGFALGPFLSSPLRSAVSGLAWASRAGIVAGVRAEFVADHVAVLVALGRSLVGGAERNGATLPVVLVLDGSIRLAWPSRRAPASMVKVS